MTHLLSVNNKKFHYVPKVKSLYLFFDVEAVETGFKLPTLVISDNLLSSIAPRLCF